ncbi:MAG: neutral/alkaline non-lysosomal ceramidase N-terminal domain-containing protein [Lentisphaerae bacterium]|nr:neutral/alkaline non-lysosomal ceramidase N-terminal domain-containing protein [Lentisphaerota bacterium]
MSRKKNAGKKRSGPLSSSAWLVGLGIADITPPLGTRMFGFGTRDRQHGCTGIHDPLQVRAVYIADRKEAVLILSYDVCFFGRAEADRIKGAVGSALPLTARQILINCSHTHLGPVTGNWGYPGYLPFEDPDYIDDVVTATVQAARAARAGARAATCRFGLTSSDLPVSRRYIDERGKAQFLPAPQIPVYKTLPVISFGDRVTGKPIAVIFAVACHPSTANGFKISADYPGVARKLIDRKLGLPVSVFLQSCGGDTKACVIADGPAATWTSGRATWRRGNWKDISRAGAVVAEAVLSVLPRLKPVSRPKVQSILTEVALPLTGIPTKAELEAIKRKDASDIRRLWAARQLKLLRQKGRLPKFAPILAQGLRLADNLQLVALEGEAVAAWGWAIEKAFRSATIPLGYSNGQGLYLPVEHMLKEGGYEVESVWEYGFAGKQFAAGFSRPLFKTFQAFRQAQVLA